MADIKSKVGSGGKILNSQSREIVSNVYKFMKDEATNGDVTIPLQKARDRTAAATGVSIRTVSRISKELDDLRVTEDGTRSFTTPNKKRTRLKTITELDNFDKCVVRRTVYDFYITEKRLPTAKLLRNSLGEKINFTGSTSSMVRILKTIGFKWKQTENNRKILIEKSDVREKRISFLQSIKRLRLEGKPIVYTDETYICSDHVSGRLWTDGSSNGLHTPISKGERLIIVHAGGEDGFVPNALAMWKSATKSGDYHHNMNSTNYITWVTNQLVPNLKPNTVLVIDNAGYHNTQIEKAPTSNSRKEEMIKWLDQRQIRFDPTMLKPQIYKIVLENKAQHMKYVLDDILAKEGHSVLRLPPYHPDLNPIEMIWATVKNHVAANNTTFKLDDVRRICEEKFKAISSEEWKLRCNHVKIAEDQYAAKEPAIDTITDNFIIRVDSISDSDDESSEVSSGNMSGVEEL